MEAKLVDVFDHIAPPEVTEKLRTAVIDDIRWVYDTFPDIRKVTLADNGSRRLSSPQTKIRFAASFWELQSNKVENPRE